MNAKQEILKALDEGLLIRNAWAGRLADGRATACTLATIAPKCGEQKSAGACSAEIMPLWLAYLTTWITDRGSGDQWEGHIRRFAATAPRWSLLTERDEYAVRAIIMREAAKYAAGARVRSACWRVIALCDRVAAGDSRAALATDFAAASAEASAAAWAADAAARAAASAEASAAAWAANAAARAAADAAWSAASAAAADAAWSAASAASAAASAEADRIIDGILTVLEGVAS